MNVGTAVMVAGGSFLALFSGFIAWLRMPKKLKAQYFMVQWREVQSFCKDKELWYKAIVDADKLLDRALKKRKFKGRSMGERLVSAQRSFSDNDGVWYAHNMAKKIVGDTGLKLKESDVKDTLVCFRRALRDIGALPSETRK